MSHHSCNTRRRTDCLTSIKHCIAVHANARRHTMPFLVVVLTKINLR